MNSAWPRIVATACCALLLASPTLTAAAQPEATPPLTIDSLLNAAYLTPPFGDTPDSSNRLVQLTDGNYVPDPTVDADHLIVGLVNNPPISASADLNGDGTQDIVAVFNQSPGGPVANPAWVVEAYLNQDGQPVPVAGFAADGGNRLIVIKSLSIQSGLMTVSGLRVGDHDAVCCPSQPFTQVLSLQGDQLVDVSASTPVSSAPDLSALKAFPGAVLLLPVDQPPYASWPLQAVRVTAGASYNEYAGDPIQRIGSDVLSIEASIGPSGYDPRSDFKPACQPATPYCYFPPFGQSSGTEIFNGLKARGVGAFVWHKTFPNESWSLWWFDKTSNTSYTLSFGGDDVLKSLDLPLDFKKSNVSAAQRLAAMSDKLVIWTGP